MRRALAAVAVAFLAAHLAWLPPALEDIDSVNFALGVRDFDVANHQPHPPGYPVFIVLGKLSTAVLRAAGVTGPEARGLAIWGAIGGAAGVLLVFAFFERLGGNSRRAAAAAVLTCAAPLFWFTAARPLSDVVGFAASFAALALVAAALAPEHKDRSAILLIAGAFVAGLSIGSRSQTMVLTLPLLAWGIVRAVSSSHQRLSAIVAFGAGHALWFIPLILATGGVDAYVSALRNQGAEDFSGVVMLWTQPSVRVAAFALLYTFVYPWHSPVLAGVVLVLAAAGALVVLWKEPRLALLLAIAFVPYAAFHLLFQETVTVRYALPLLPAVAYLAAVPLTSFGPSVAVAGVVAVALPSLWLAVPATMAFARESSPIARLMADLQAESHAPVVAMHRRVWSETRRARRWWGAPPGRLLEAPRDYEWLELTRAWREGATGPAWFLADPRRTDLALIDPQARRTRSYRWPFDHGVYVGGVRPDEIDWHVYSSPGWFLEQGWALTPEVAGISQREGWEPHMRPAAGWVRSRPDPAVLMFGGRHLGAAGSPPAVLHLKMGDREIASLTTGPGFFLRFVELPAGALAGDGSFVQLSARAAAAPGTSEVPRMAVEQFDLQPPDTVMFGFDEGWYEPEYNPRTARSWRWMSERAVLRVRPATRDVTLTISGESPLRYFDAAPSIRITVAGQEVARVAPSADFTWEVRLPSKLLAGGGGQVVVESDKWFVPAERGTSPDPRRLALRIYGVSAAAAAN